MPKTSKEKITGWLMRAGFRVEEGKHPIPPEAEWGLEVFTPPPLQVHLRIFYFPRRKLIVSGIGIGLAEPHRVGVIAMSPEDRTKLSSDLLQGIMALCPHCRISMQPSPFVPERVVVEEGVLEESLEAQRLLDTMSRLVNVYILVNAILWRYFPETAGQQQESREGKTSGTVYM